MSKNVKINGVTYSNVPQVDIPKSDGSGDTTFYDTTGANLTANDLRSGVTAYGPNGAVSGNLATIAAATTELTAKAQEVTIPAGIHSGTGKVKLSAADQNALVAANIKSGVTILGVAGSMSAATVSQDGSTKVLRIS